MRRLLLIVVATTIMLLLVAGPAAAAPPPAGGFMMGSFSQTRDLGTELTVSFYFMAGGDLTGGMGHMLYVHDSEGFPVEYHAFDIVKFYRKDAHHASCVGVLRSTSSAYYISQGYVNNAWMVLWVRDKGNGAWWIPSESIAWRWRMESPLTPGSDIPPDSWLTDWIVPTDDGPAPVVTLPISIGGASVY